MSPRLRAPFTGAMPTQVAPTALGPRLTGLDLAMLGDDAWLAKQEAQLEGFGEELEQADIGTPIDASKNLLRGRLAMRRVRQPNALNLPSPARTPRYDDGSVKIVDPSDKQVTYRMPAMPSRRLGTARGTPKGAPAGSKPTLLGTPIASMPALGPIPSDRPTGN